MDLSRRQFLKFTGTALAASALPLSALASFLTEPTKTPPSFVLHNVKKGDYVFTFYWKNDLPDMWVRHVHYLNVIDDMDITILMPVTGKTGVLGGVGLYPEKLMVDPEEVKVSLLNHSVIYGDPHRQ